MQTGSVKYVLVFFLCLLVQAIQSQHYKTVHKKAIVIDTHNDVLTAATMKGLNMHANLLGKTHSDINRFFKGGIDIQVFSVFCNEDFGKDTAYKHANIQIDSLYSIISRDGVRLMLVKTPKELRYAAANNKLGFMIGVEGGHMIEDDIDNIDSLYQRGVRYLTLTWNNSTSWASSAKDEFNAKRKGNTPQPYGLTEAGRAIVGRMNKLGMMVDLSHVGEKTFWDVLEIVTKPVLLSHSSVHAICPVYRNVNDEQIKAVAKNGGVIQVNFFPEFIDPQYRSKRNAILEEEKKEKEELLSNGVTEQAVRQQLRNKYGPRKAAILPSLDKVMDHIDHIVKLVGIDYVGIGADMDGINSLPKELKGVQDYPLITKALLQRGYTEEDVIKILGGNFIRVFEANSVL